METSLELKFSTLDDQEKVFVNNIREHGWFGTHVNDDEEGPGFSYTTGFWHRFKVPEVVVFSIPSEATHQIFWNIFNDLEAGKQFPLDTPIAGVLNEYDVFMGRISKDHFNEYLGWNQWFYRGDHFEAQQLIWPDKSGNFPWSDGASSSFIGTQSNLTGHNWRLD